MNQPFATWRWAIAPRRSAPVLVAMALLATACSSDTDTPGPTAAADAATQAATPAPTDCPGTVSHFAGETEITEPPERVVALGGNFTSDMLSLGITPAAIGDGDTFQLAAYDQLLPEGTNIDAFATIGDPYAPNIEALAAIEPDLIIGDEFQEDYETLSSIAPTVLVNYRNNGGWRERFVDTAAAVCRSDEVDVLDAAYEEAIAALPDELDGQVIAFVRGDATGFLLDSLPTAFAGSVADDAGLTTLQPDIGEFDEDSGFLEISGENLDVLADADLIVTADLSDWGFDDADTATAIAENPLWDTLPAVEAGNVLRVAGPVYNGGNYFAAMLLLEALNPASTALDVEVSDLVTAAGSMELALAPDAVSDTARTVEHLGRTTDVPLDPQRIVTLEPSLTDAVAALGFGDRIVGTVQEGPASEGAPFHDHVEELLGDDVLNVGDEGAPNLEQIALAQPDVILTWDYYSDNLDDLDRIAPTVAVPYTWFEDTVSEVRSDQQWVTWLTREIAAVLGADAQVDDALAPAREAIASGREELSSILGDDTVALVDIRPDSILLSGYGFDGVSALLYGDLGATIEPLSAQLYVWEELSPERAGDLSAEWLIAFADGDDAKDRLSELLASPLWQQVPAVAAGRVVVVPSGLYYRGDDGPLGVPQLIDDLIDRLREVSNDGG
jgi:iron complex transport system substrate-binding protein